MKIERIQLIPISVSRETGVTNEHILVKVEAQGCFEGWGEMSDLSHVPMYRFDVPGLERTLNELLRGMDARNIAKVENLLIQFFPDEGHMYSRSGLIREGVDLALHDLVGRVDNVSVCTLLGGQLRDRMKVCYPVFRMRSRDQIEPNLARVEAKLQEGFDLVRVYVGANPDVDALFLTEFSQRFANRVTIKSIDFSNLLDWRRASRETERLSECADFMLVESVAPRDDLDGLTEFRRRSRWPVSEHVQNLQHGWRLLHGGAVDILNISPYLVGGLRASTRLANLAEAARASVLIGTTQELNLGTAAAAHLGATLHVSEYPADNVGPRLYTQDVTRDTVQYEAGYLLVPQGAGLGLQVDETLVEALRTGASGGFDMDLAALQDRTPATPLRSPAS